MLSDALKHGRATCNRYEIFLFTFFPRVLVVNRTQLSLVFVYLCYFCLCQKCIEDITRWLEDMNFMFECQEPYLTSERSERLGY